MNAFEVVLDDISKPFKADRMYVRLRRYLVESLLSSLCALLFTSFPTFIHPLTSVCVKKKVSYEVLSNIFPEKKHFRLLIQHILHSNVPVTRRVSNHIFFVLVWVRLVLDCPLDG